MSFMSPPPPGFTSEVLPPSDTVRWVPSRKAAVINAINDGRITVEEACQRWRLSIEEIQLWQRAMDKAGQPGLRVTRVQIYRPLFESDEIKVNND
ncbi:DUF1153 domain-containing protein [Sandarakinorhabdus oryzae]|uniref:DUF1153 domain-containing protein n=1 Tax=Sandarakinorhabdus oryzae TaxID=2675220 RepID=UPI0012E2EB9B|nr:DUF1153 domain-containing protein [Sandarakinorhabdus oryzae]